MRFNKDTERGISIEEIANQCHNAIKDLPRPQPRAFGWKDGRWVLMNSDALNPLVLA